MYWFNENIQKRASPECASQKVLGGQQKELGAFCPCDKWSALAGHFSPLNPPRTPQFVPYRGRETNLCGWQIYWYPHEAKHLEVPVKAPGPLRREIELPFISSWIPVKYFMFHERRPGSLDFVKNNIYFHTLGRRAPLKGLLKYSHRCNVSTARFSWCAEIYVDDFRVSTGAGSDFFIGHWCSKHDSGRFACATAHFWVHRCPGRRIHLGEWL